MFVDRTGWYCFIYEMPYEDVSYWLQRARCPVCDEEAIVQIPVSRGFEDEPRCVTVLDERADMLFAQTWREHAAASHRAA